MSLRLKRNNGKSFGRVKGLWTFEEIEEAEQKLLGQIFLEPERLCKIADSLEPQDFRYEKHRTIFKAMKDLKQLGIDVDIVTVWEILGEEGKLQKVGGSMYLTFLPSIVLREEEKWHDMKISRLMTM